jgi:trehalose/maltose hydrolase-like predicted phosphorylase
LESDVGDVQGGTTKEGIHLGVMAGTLDLVQSRYAGLSIRDGVLHFAPQLTDRLPEWSFPVQFRGTPVQLTFADGRLTVDVHPDGQIQSVPVAIGDDVRELRPGDRYTFEPVHEQSARA